MSTCPANIDLYILKKSGSEIGKSDKEIDDLFIALTQNKTGGGCDSPEQKKEAIMFILGTVTNIFNAYQMSKCFLTYYKGLNNGGESSSMSQLDLDYLKSEVNNFVSNSIHDTETQKQIVINLCWNVLLYISKNKTIDYLSNKDFILLTPILNIICDYLNKKTQTQKKNNLDEMTDEEYQQYLEEEERDERGGGKYKNKSKSKKLKSKKLKSKKLKTRKLKTKKLNTRNLNTRNLKNRNLKTKKY